METCQVLHLREVHLLEQLHAEQPGVEGQRHLGVLDPQHCLLEDEVLSGGVRYPGI